MHEKALQSMNDLETIAAELGEDVHNKIGKVTETEQALQEAHLQNKRVSQGRQDALAQLQSEQQQHQATMRALEQAKASLEVRRSCITK